MNGYQDIKIIDRDQLTEEELISKTPCISSEFLFKIDYDFEYNQEDNGTKFLSYYEQKKALNTTAKKVLLEISQSQLS